MPFASGPRAKAKRVMRSLPSSVQERLAAQNAANADDLVGTIKGFVPVDKGDLRASARREAVASKSQIAQRVSLGGSSTTKAIGKRAYDREVKIGSGDTKGRKKQSGGAKVTYDYALGNEFGTEDMPAHPSFWPAWRLKRRRYKARMSKAGKKGIQEATTK